MVEWKEGMMVTVKKNCNGCVPGRFYILTKDTIQTGLRANGYKAEGVHGCACTSNWIFSEIDWEKRTQRGDLI